MLRVVRWMAAVLVAYCALMTALAVLAPGRAIAVPPGIGALGFAACAPPCWAGIMVGETPLDDVAGRFAMNVSAPRKALDQAADGAVYWGVSGSDAEAATQATAFSGNLLARSESRRVTYLHLNLDVPVWYLLLTLGRPQSVELHEPFPDVPRLEMVLRWALPTRQVAAIVPLPATGDWDLQAVAVSLSVAEIGPREGFGRSQRAWHIVGTAEWQGFAPLTRYLQSAVSGDILALQAPAT